MRTFAIVTGLLVLTACGAVAQKVSSGISNKQLASSTGQRYEDVLYRHPYYGKLIGREKLGDGNEIMKHVGDFGSAESEMAGLYGKKRQNARVLYFLVDSSGVVKDWATAVYEAGTATCWVGFCAGSNSEQVPLEELDRIVRTSSGAELELWRAAH